MKRAILLAAVCVALAGCGPGIPPVGNYATVSGQITDSATNAGVAGAVITVNAVQSATSDANGDYKITSVPTGPWSYSVVVPSGSGYATPAGSDSASPLSPGETRTLSFALTKS